MWRRRAIAAIGIAVAGVIGYAVLTHVDLANVYQDSPNPQLAYGSTSTVTVSAANSQASTLAHFTLQDGIHRTMAFPQTWNPTLGDVDLGLDTGAVAGNTHYYLYGVPSLGNDLQMTTRGSENNPISYGWKDPALIGRKGSYVPMIRLASGKVLMAGGLDTVAINSAVIYDPATNSWAATGTMIAARHLHACVLLASTGKVLCAGGNDAAGTTLSTAELYDPTTGQWAATGSMNASRGQFTAIWLATQQKALLCGGYSNPGGTRNTCELYDPVAGTFSYTGTMASQRYSYGATVLSDGKVLYAGGYTADYKCEVYDPVAGTFAATGRLITGRVLFAIYTLSNGKVLVAGGVTTGATRLASAELWDPTAIADGGASGAWTETGSMSTERGYNPAYAQLATGKPIIIGGRNTAGTYLTTTETYDVDAGTWTAAGSMNLARIYLSAVTLASGKVLTAMGSNGGGVIDNAGELYDPTADAWSWIGMMATSRIAHVSEVLASGKVLIAGGYSATGSATTATAELYDTATASYSATGSLGTPRQNACSVLLSSGKVLVAGGRNGTTHLDTAELYDPVAGTFSYTGTMARVRAYATCTVLPSGKVLVAGGDNPGVGGWTDSEVYDPATELFTTTGSMGASGWSHHRAVLLNTGYVLVAGSAYAANTSLLYNPTANTWAATGSRSSGTRYLATLSLLQSGDALFVGGYSGSAPSTDVEIYSPGAGTWSTGASMAISRCGHVAVVLPSGKVLVAGGFTSPAKSLVTELYSPASGAWSTMMSSQSYHVGDNHLAPTAVLLTGGRVMFVGGYTTTGYTPTAHVEFATMGPQGYSAWHYLGAVHTDASSNIERFQQAGMLTWLSPPKSHQLLAADDASATALSIAADIPTTATAATIRIEAESATAPLELDVWGDMVTTGTSDGGYPQSSLRVYANPTGASDTNTAEVPTRSQTIYYKRAGTTDAGTASGLYRLLVLGYREVTALPPQ